MSIVSLFILVGPAALTWKLCDALGYKQSEKTRDTLLTLLVDSLLILACAYIVCYKFFGITSISFSPVHYEMAEKTLFMVPFVSKYTVLSSALSILLAAAKIVVFKLTAAKRGS